MIQIDALPVALLLGLVPACASPPARPLPARAQVPGSGSVASPASPASPAAPAAAARVYPVAPTSDTVDTYHGIKIADPYRPLEQLDAPETRRWVEAENRLTDAVLPAPSSPLRQAFRARIGELTSVPSDSAPQVRRGRAFWAHHDGQQDQAVVLTASMSATASASDGAVRVLLDPNALSPDGSLALGGFVPSSDGARLAYGLALGGGDWHRWRVRDVATGKDLSDEIADIKYYAPQFAGSGAGLYYSRFPTPPPGKELVEPDHDCKVYFHELGTPASSDRVVYARQDHPSWQFRPTVTDDGRYLAIEIGDGEVGDRGVEQLAYLDLSRPGARPVELVDRFDAEYVFLGNDGPIFYVQTSLGAPKKRIVAIDTRAPAREKWREIVPAGDDAIDSATLAGRQLIVTRVHDVHAAAAAYDLAGKKLRDVPLPGLGTAYGFLGDARAKETYFAFQSFTTPRAVYKYDLATGKTTLAPAVASAGGRKLPFDPAELETTQVFYPGKDGTKIPMFVTAKKGLARDGSHPTLLTGYGGAVALMPWFDPMAVAWMERGGVFAVANVRGGSEYGEEWAHAAEKTHKQVSFDDFIAGASWLVSSRITSQDKLGILGRSGGGLLVAAVAMQRPDLFGAVAPLAGVHDMLRFTLFGEGAGWAGAFGSPEAPEELESLRKYSPLHNVRPGTRYPAMYLVTADHDVRVAPLHSYKMAAALQAAQAGPAPILLRVETTAGHGGATRRSAWIEAEAELAAFFAQSLAL